MPVQKKVSGGTPKKKGKGVRKSRRRDSVQLEDVAVNTSLPPKVDGQARCHLRVSITQILWNVANAPDFTQVRLLWWGEEGNGAVFRPVDVKKGEKKGPMHNTIARYPVRSGPRQLASYFTDMGSITLDVLGGRHAAVVGRASIDSLAALTPNKPINGFFPVFSADDEKVGELQVSIVLESLMASYDSMSTVPTPDMSLQVRESFSEAQPVNPPRIIPTPAPQPVYSTTDDPFRSPTANKKRSDHVTPQGVDSLIYGQRHSGVRESGFSYPSSGPSFPRSSEDVRRSASSAQHSKETLETSTAAGVRSSQEGFHRNLKYGAVSGGSETVVKGVGQQYATLADISNKGSKDLMSTFSSGGRDLVSELLERGEKLREAMIVSTLHTTPGIEKVDPSKPLHHDSVAPTGRFYKDMANDSLPVNYQSLPPDASDLLDKKDRYAIGGGFGSVGVGVRVGYDTMSLSGCSDLEANTIDLVLGPDADVEQTKLMRDAMGTPTSSLSDGDINSDMGDPIHDDDILSELFYKNPDTEESDLSLSDGETEKMLKDQGRSDSVASLHEPGNIRPPSRGSRRSSCSSIHLDLEPTRDVETESPKSTPKKKKKGKKKKRPTVGYSDYSESEGLSTSRTSETSRVSFDPVPSDSEDARADTSRGSRKRGVDGLSVERLTLLGRVHVARVVIENLALSLSQQTTPTKSKGRGKLGKPPRPVKKASTYFVEYQFPVVATSRDKYSPSAMATEVMRVASKKVSDGMVTFGHRSVFPVMFDGEAIDKWWKSALVFKVYSRSPAQKVPSLLGLCSIPLKSVLKSEALFLDEELEVKDRSGSASSKKSRTSGHPLVGLLKLTIELASDSKDFAKALARTRLAEMTNAKIVALPQTPPAKGTLNDPDLHKQPRGDVKLTSGTQTEPRPTNLNEVPLAPPPSPERSTTLVPEAPPQSTHRTFGPQTRTTPLDACANTMEPVESLTLHTYLSIPEGENISLHGVHLPQHRDKNPSQAPKPLTGWTGRDMRTRNLYLVCRMFWLDDAARSGVCWGTIDPEFKFIQVAPVLLTGSLLERLRNNFVVVEVWDKKTTADSDQIVGIVKLPVHQFYMSFRDRRIAGSLLKSQYPVISVDTSMPVSNPFTGATHGQIKVVFAMGSAEQISSLQHLKKDGGTAVMSPERPLHYLERKDLGQDAYQTQSHHTCNENIIEHVFEVCVEGVRGLQLLETMIWGEADCFIQYHFPSQTQTHPQTGPSVVHAGLSLKTFRTATTLCVPDPVFNDVLKHKITMPEGTPVQREILTACAGAGGGPGGVPMEVWCRYYYPNTRDQLIAKGTLPLAKLCAMVTMKRHGEANVQTFSLPLSHVGGEDGGSADSGLIDITVNYRTHVTKVEAVGQYTPVSHALPGAQVCLSVSVLRASALKAAASAAARHDPAMQYVSEVGVNSYVRVHMSFLQKQDERVTRTVARSFAPEFSYHMDFPVPLLWTEVDCDALSLAEILDSAEVTFEVWHQSPCGHQDITQEYDTCGDVKGRRLVARGDDVLLGSTTLPLIDLLKKSSGIRGWFPVNMPSMCWESRKEGLQEEDPSSHHSHHGDRGLERVVGGVEINVKFAYQEDRERVLHAGRGVGWVPEFEVEARDWEEADDQADGYYEVVVSADFVTCPLASALLAGQTSLDKNAHFYIRYKYYDRNAVCSTMSPADENDEGYVTCEFNHSKTLVLPASAPYNWYLNEEKLELQVWLTFHPHTKESGTGRPRNRDKLIGSAYVPLDSLADHRRRQHRVSGVYPLFKPGAANLGGACIRAHVSMRPHTAGYQTDSEDETDVCCHKHERSPKVKSPVKVTSPLAPPVDRTNTFSVHVSVERAYHLSHVTDKTTRFKRSPSCYVSYQSAERDEPLYTAVVENNDSPIWSYGRETRLHKTILSQDNKNLVFKAWHKPEGSRPEPDKTTDQVLGFVSVDLAPLTAGFSQIAGWYNIIDFNGLCQGQIKIAVVPQEAVEVEVGCGSPQRQTSLIGAGLGLPHISSHLGINNPLLDGESQGVLARFSQHYENVKHFHESLAARLHGSVPQKPADMPQESRSTLFNSLRSNMAELDTITNKLKMRLHPSPSVPSSNHHTTPAEALNFTGHSTQTETETSALTNSQQFLPLPNDIPTTSNDEMRLTGESVAMARDDNMMSRLTSGKDHTGNDVSVTSLVHSTVKNLWIERHDGELGNETLREQSKTEDDVSPFGTYRSGYPDISDADQQWPGLTDEDIGAGGGVGFHDNTEDGHHDSEDGGEVVIPRALNDVSNVNFNNLAGLDTIQDSTTRLDEEDSWFGLSPHRNGAQRYDETINPEELQRTYPESSAPDQDLSGLGGTLTTLGGTVSSLGTVREGDPYGRTLLGGRFNKTGKIDLNYEDSWATHNLSGTQDLDDVEDEEEHREREERVLEEPYGGAAPVSNQNKPHHGDTGGEVDSEEERSLLLEEDPLSFSSVSRTTLSDSNRSKSTRKAAIFRREYERHRHGDKPNDEERERRSRSRGGETSTESEEERTSSRSQRRRPRRPRSRASQKSPEVRQKSEVYVRGGHDDVRGHSSESEPEMSRIDIEREKKEEEDREGLRERLDRPAWNNDGDFEQDQTLNITDQTRGSEYHEHQDESKLSDKSDHYNGLSTGQGGSMEGTQVSEMSHTLTTGHSKGHNDSWHNLSQGSQGSKSSTRSVPNFFLPPKSMEHNMRALRTGMGCGSDLGGSFRDKSGVAARFTGTSSAKSRPLPDSQHTQRIAKIFSSKFSK